MSTSPTMRQLVRSAAGAAAISALAGGCVKWPESYSTKPGQVTRRQAGGTPERADPANTSPWSAERRRAEADAAARGVFRVPSPSEAPTDGKGPGVTYIARMATAPGSGDEPQVNVTQVSFARVGADFDPDISRDGRLVAFASTQHQNAADIYIKAVDSRVVTQLTSDTADDTMPKFSPDGSKIAFASNRAGNWDIYVMPASGGSAVRATESPANELHPSWSPDGTQLVFSRLGEVSGQWEIWVTDALNSGVAHFVCNGLFPEWCPRSGTGEAGADRILFQRGRQRGDHAFGVWTIDFRDGRSSSPTEVASSPGAACINPAWSPDGRWIAFSVVPVGGVMTAGERVSELWMADLNGSARIRLAGGPVRALMPSWGPDGRVYFASDRGGTENIWSVNATEAVRLAGSIAPRPGVATAPDEQPQPER